MKTVAFHTLGCKLNFSETSSLKREFEDHDFLVTGFSDKADVYVINTCSVTQDANSDCRKYVRQALRRNPDAFVAVTGCYAQLEPQEIAEIKGVDVVIGARDKFKLFELAGQFEKKDKTIIHHTDVNEAVDFHHAFSSSDRTRAFLKIQDGCDYKCSFCTIPLARGKSRSPLIAEILKNARQVLDEGYREIVLTGVNAGDFGRYNGESFLELLMALDRIDGLERIRISSIEPNLLHDDIIRFAADSRTIQPHFHIPLQSGSDTMLAIMKRRYRTDLYRKRIGLIRQHMPSAAIGVDVITGHPGETEELFRETIDFIQALDVSYLHVFTYSERPNTTALDISPVIPVPERRKRTHVLRRLSKQKRFDFDTRHAGQQHTVLFESEPKNGLIAGWTENYIRVYTPFHPTLVNAIKKISLDQYDTETGGYIISLPLSIVKESAGSVHG
ncbi:MAG: tRNA (N(6)-L-threonylcarbamoyladenosine(37)-C(2))-methylthiotransferase MtaB [Rhodothermaceae bacterium]|nr:tRNA (N(6)-L-threonylcarbamoyladenosine(37)-C(2))-methylthiotransferase MtaB [Rhodothermaceae bacterium]